MAPDRGKFDLGGLAIEVFGRRGGLRLSGVDGSAEMAWRAGDVTREIDFLVDPS